MLEEEKIYIYIFQNVPILYEACFKNDYEQMKTVYHNSVIFKEFVLKFSAF